VNRIKTKIEVIKLSQLEFLIMLEKFKLISSYAKMLIFVTFNPASFLYLLLGFLVGAFIPLFFSLKVLIVFVLSGLFLWKGRKYLNIILGKSNEKVV